ncbi:MAG TPA: NADH-quinone oxidoreductase subunit M [Propionicimonas sp.]|jgi:NADH-quinone oxidoreductase subunit M|nr:NADH-quinone oxidoreductase subunit M [Propionicimonas sp.]
MTVPWLTILGLLPLLGAAVLCLPVQQIAKGVGMTFALLTAGVGIGVATLAGQGVPLAERAPWIPAFGASWALDLDGMSLMMVLLTVVLTPAVLLAEWRLADGGGSAKWGPRAYVGLVLALEGLSLLVFMAGDVLLFYLLFEATLIPVYFLIGGYGGARRSYAAIKFLLFSLAGGLVMLFSVIGIYAESTRQFGTPTYLLSDLAALRPDQTTGMLLMVGFLIAFIIKAPMVPLHTWLPTAAEESTPGTSVLLVGVLDKIGTFGMIKFCVFLFPDASRAVGPTMIVLALVSILYGALAAIGSKNLLRLVAYTSISHFGFMVLGIYTFTTVGTSGTIFYMLNHGFSTGALFLVLGFLITRRGSALVDAYGGVQKVAPVLAGTLLLAGLSSLALPGMSSFVSEFMVMAGAWSREPWVAAVAALGTVLAAVYILLMYQRTMTGPVTDQVSEGIRSDLNLREKVVAAPLIAVMLVLGFVPQLALTQIEPTVSAVLAHAGVSDPVAPLRKEAK